MPRPTRVDPSGLQKRLGDIIKIVGGDGRRIVRTEMSHLIEDLAAATTKPNKQLRRINRDFYVAFRLSPTGKPVDLQELYRVLDSFGKRGRRLPTAVKAYYVERARHQQRIGHLAAGWLGGGNPTRAHVPPAVARQRVLGTFRVIDTPTSYRLVATNQVAFARHMRGLTIIIQKAVNKRAAALRVNAALIKAGVKKYQSR